MAFDGVAISCVIHELKQLCLGGRVDKILQPEFDEINLLIHSNGKNYRLAASASSSNPRVHLTKIQKENPLVPPMFCMLLRKHLTSGRIVDFSQPEFERIIAIHIESRDELGDLSVKKLIIEIMGRHSNIILVDGQNKILGSIKHVDFSVSSVRQLIPGMMYEMPPSQGKINPMETRIEQVSALLYDYPYEADKFIIDNFTGIGPLTAREMAYLSLGDHSADISFLSSDEKLHFSKYICNFFENIRENKYEPVLLYKTKDKIWDFSGVNITQYEEKIIVEKRESLNEAIDEFYATKDLQERITQKTAGLMKFIETNIGRCQKKYALQQQKLKDCKNKESYKIYGDLILGNLHKIEKNAEFVVLENYYDNMNEVKINLKPELTPSQNAQRYYTLYQKAKNAEVMTSKQLELTEMEIDYLESVQESLLRAKSERDINEIRDELYSQGYAVKRGKTIKNKKSPVSQPLRFEILDGFEVYVGKNNTQNDELTFKFARSNDIWFHTKKIHGSHTVLKTNGKVPSDDVIVQAAKLCAYYSKARNSANVPVDYTIIKNVKKPSGSKPGFVIYDNYNTVNVKPAPYEEL